MKALRSHSVFLALALCLAFPSQAQSDSARKLKASFQTAKVAALGPAQQAQAGGVRDRQLATRQSVDLRDVPLMETLEVLAGRYGVGLIVSPSLVPEGRVTLHLQSATLAEALSALSAGRSVEAYLSPGGNIALRERVAPNAMQQQGVITGTVTDSLSGAPIPGTNVVLEGTQQGASTNADGTYAITGVEAGRYTLRASFVGYENQSREGVEVRAGDTTVVDFVLRQGAEDLGEVVVVGYGQTQKSDLTGSVSSIAVEELTEIPVPRIDQALQGRAPGLHVMSNSGAPGAGSTIRIRGGNSITASNDPLFVVDGIPTQDDNFLNSLDASDIASIEVLKDATSTSVYGSRGANGVILIETKQGAAGEQHITFGSYVGWQEQARRIDMMTGPQRAEYMNEFVRYSGQSEVPYADPASVPTTDWQDQIAQAAPMMSADLSISGGTQDARYYLSGNYFNQSGIIRNSGFRRYQLRMNLDNQLGDRFTVGTHLNLSRVRTNHSKTSFTRLVFVPTTVPVRDENGEYTTIVPAAGQPFRNPVADIELKTDYSNRSRLLGNVFVEYEPLGSVRLRSSVGTNYTFEKQNAYSPGRLPRRILRGQGGYANVSSSEDITLVNENTVHVDYSFQDVHSVEAVAGVTYEANSLENVRASSAGFSNDLLEFNSLQAGDPDQYGVRSYSASWTLLSVLGRANYSYLDRYLFTVAARRDGSSRFGEGNKWAFFPSAAVGWRVSEEPFLQDAKRLSNLKLRASYGITGNQAIGVYSTYPTLQSTSVIFGGAERIGYRLGALPNSDLKWETTRQFDLGVELGFFKDRITLEMDYYRKRTDDLLLDTAIPTTTGYSRRLDNVGSVQNQGLELAVETVNVTTSNFMWSTNLSIAGNRNKVLDLGTRDTLDIGFGAYLIEGQSAPAIFGWRYEGTWKSQSEIEAVGTMPTAEPGFPRFSDINGNGQLDGVEDYTILGNPEPDFYGGIQNTFRYRGWTASFFLQGSYGNDILNELSRTMFFGNDDSSSHYAEVVNRWTPENPDSDIPRPNSRYGEGTPSSALVEDGSHLRLKSVSVSYQIPARQLGLSSLQRLRVYAHGTNLWLWSHYRGYDPERSSSNPLGQGFQTSSYPTKRALTVGVDISL